MCAAAGVPLTTLARIEAGATVDPRLSTVARLINAAGGRLLICDRDNQPIPPEPEIHDQYRDLAHRRLPAHLDPQSVDYDCFWPWWSPKRGEFTFIRARWRRDQARADRHELMEQCRRERREKDAQQES